jgi:hypothetical protein
VGHVKLVETWPRAIGFSYLFDTGTSGCGKTVRQIKLAGDFCNGCFAGWVVDFVNADGREADGRGDAVAEDLSRGVAVVGVD